MVSSSSSTQSFTNQAATMQGVRPGMSVNVKIKNLGQERELIGKVTRWDPVTYRLDIANVIDVNTKRSQGMLRLFKHDKFDISPLDSNNNANNSQDQNPPLDSTNSANVSLEQNPPAETTQVPKQPIEQAKLNTKPVEELKEDRILSANLSGAGLLNNKLIKLTGDNQETEEEMCKQLISDHFHFNVSDYDSADSYLAKLVKDREGGDEITVAMQTFYYEGPDSFETNYEEFEQEVFEISLICICHNDQTVCLDFETLVNKADKSQQKSKQIFLDHLASFMASDRIQKVVHDCYSLNVMEQSYAKHQIKLNNIIDFNLAIQMIIKNREDAKEAIEFDEIVREVLGKEMRFKGENSKLATHWRERPLAIKHKYIAVRDTSLLMAAFNEFMAEFKRSFLKKSKLPRQTESASFYMLSEGKSSSKFSFSPLYQSSKPNSGLPPSALQNSDHTLTFTSPNISLNHAHLNSRLDSLLKSNDQSIKEEPKPSVRTFNTLLTNNHISKDYYKSFYNFKPAGANCPTNQNSSLRSKY